MAKKPAPKKKTSPAKPASKTVKKSSSKPVAKSASKASSKPVPKAAAKAPAKSVKPAPKAPKASPQPVAPAPKKVVAAKPVLMTKKGKAPEPEEEIEETRPAIKNQSVVSMMESDASSDEPSKAEKTSKVKPVKIERGNISDEKAKWAELNKKYGKDKAVQYKMSEKFTTMTPMQHKILGWGFILTNENDRLEVLFETGIRMLISNYKT